MCQYGYKFPWKLPMLIQTVESSIMFVLSVDEQLQNNQNLRVSPSGLSLCVSVAYAGELERQWRRQQGLGESSANPAPEELSKNDTSPVSACFFWVHYRYQARVWLGFGVSSVFVRLQYVVINSQGGETLDRISKNLFSCSREAGVNRCANASFAWRGSRKCGSNCGNNDGKGRVKSYMICFITPVFYYSWK